MTAKLPSSQTQSNASRPSPAPKTEAKKSKPPETAAPKAEAPKALTNEQIKKLPVGGSSRKAITQATGGRAEKIGRRNLDNTFALKLWGRRFVYVRNQGKNADRNTAYNTDSLRKAIAPDAAKSGKQLDHTASTAIEGGRMGNKFTLVSIIPGNINASHGGTNEKSPAPTREAHKAFQGGLNHRGQHHVSYMTNEMALKLAGKPSPGNRRSLMKGDLSATERRAISTALLQDRPSQERLRILTRQSENAKAKPVAQVAKKTKGRGI